MRLVTYISIIILTLLIACVYPMYDASYKKPSLYENYIDKSYSDTSKMIFLKEDSISSFDKPNFLFFNIKDSTIIFDNNTFHANNNKIFFFSLSKKIIIDSLIFRPQKEIYIIQFNQKGNKFIILLTDYFGIPDSIFCYDIHQKRFLWKIKTPDYGNDKWDNIIHNIFFINNDKEFITIGWEKINFYNSETGQLQSENKTILSKLNKNKFKSSSISPDRRYIAVWETFVYRKARLWFLTPGPNHSIYLWDLKENKLISEIQMPEYGISDAEFSHDNSTIYFGGMDGTISVWSFKERKIIKTINAFKDFTEISCVILSKDDKYLSAFRRYGFNSKFFNTYTFNLEAEYKGIECNSSYWYRSLFPVTYTPDGKYLMFIANGKLHLYELGTWKEIWSIKINP